MINKIFRGRCGFFCHLSFNNLFSILIEALTSQSINCLNSEKKKNNLIALVSTTISCNLAKIVYGLFTNLLLYRKRAHVLCAIRTQYSLWNPWYTIHTYFI